MKQIESMLIGSVHNIIILLQKTSALKQIVMV